MDLVAGVRKEGSRGGRADFKWSDVQSDQHRENYLGHSLMAPVGRWQKNRDLSWYAKGDTSKAAQSAADARAEEIKRIKEAEQDALSEALGYPVVPKLKPVEKVEAADLHKAIGDAGNDDEDEDARGVGFGGVTGLAAAEPKADSEMMPAQLNRNKAGAEIGIEDEGAEAGIVIDIEDTKTWKSFRIGGIDKDHKNEIGMNGEGHGRGALSAGGPMREPASHEEIAAIRLTHDAGIDPGRDLETQSMIDTAETDHRRDVCNTISEGQPLNRYRLGQRSSIGREARP